MRKHTYISVMTLPAVSNKRGIGALAPAQNAGIEAALFWDYPG